jgi:hypothetical protein
VEHQKESSNLLLEQQMPLHLAVGTQVALAK